MTTESSKPDARKVVPREPTQEMLDAVPGMDAIPDDVITHVWRAMHDAAPVAAPAPAKEVRVIAAAILDRDGHTIHFISPPARHHTVMQTLHLPQARYEEQGFLLSDGTYAERDRAMVVAKAAGQLLPCAPTGPASELYSEDVWNSPEDASAPAAEPHLCRNCRRPMMTVHEKWCIFSDGVTEPAPDQPAASPVADQSADRAASQTVTPQREPSIGKQQRTNDTVTGRRDAHSPAAADPDAIVATPRCERMRRDH